MEGASMIGSFASSMATALDTMVTDITSGFGTIAPIVLPLLAGVIGVFAVLRLSKRISRQGANA